MGVNASDFEAFLPSLKQASGRMVKEYQLSTHPKLKMLDALIVLSLATFVIQYVYANFFVFNRDPYNSYLAGLFCSLGQFALSGNLSAKYL